MNIQSEVRRRVSSLFSQNRKSDPTQKETLEQITQLLCNRVSDLEGKVSALERKQAPSIHSMELTEHNRKASEDERLGALSDPELRKDLERHYGTTDWAVRVVDEIIEKRAEGLESSFSETE